LGCGRCFGGRFPLGALREMGLDGVVTGPRADAVFRKDVQLQILYVFPRFDDYFVNFVRGDGPMVFVGRAGLFNSNCEGIMVTAKIGKHTVEMYDAIDELPIVRFHKYQKLLLIDAGVGADIAAFDQRIEKTRRFLMDGKPEKAQQELENLRQAVYLIQSEISPKHRAFAALVTKIDGRDCNDLSDDALTGIVDTLNDAPENELTAQLEAVKKKIDGELRLYFPALFADSGVKEYYDLLKKRTMAVLANIIAGEKNPDATPDIERLTTELITYSQPQTFTGSDGVEIQFDRQFENLCLVLSEQLHVKPKKYTVLEFYNAFDFVKERAKEHEKAQKRAK
jgi:hypothetical protein